MLKDTLTEDKPKAVRRIGLVIVIYSSLLILSNILKVFLYVSNGRAGLGEVDTDNVSTIHFLANYQLEISILALLTGIALFIGGIGLRKYLLWANKLVTLISVILILYVVGFMLMTLNAFQEMGGVEPAYLMGFSMFLVVTVPLGLTIWYLNRKGTLKHFTQRIPPSA